MTRRAVFISLIDQGFVSLTTILLSVGLIVGGDAAAFGEFAFILTLIMIFASLQHGMVGVHLLIELGAKNGTRKAGALQVLGSFDLYYRVVVALTVTAASTAVTLDAGTLVAAGAFAFFYLWREVARNILFATARETRAMLLDGLALVLIVASYPPLLSVHNSSLTPVATASFGYGISLAVFGRGLFGRLLSPKEAVIRFNFGYRQSRWTLLTSVSNEIKMRAYVVVVEVFRGIAQLGLLEAGRVLWGPLIFLVSAWRRVAQPHLARAISRGQIAEARLIGLAGFAGVIAACGLYALLVWACWGLLGVHVFKGDFAASTPYVIAWGVFFVFLVGNWTLAIYLDAVRQFRLVALGALATAIYSIAVLALVATEAELILVVYGMTAGQLFLMLYLFLLFFTCDPAAAARDGRRDGRVSQQLPAE